MSSKKQQDELFGEERFYVYEHFDPETRELIYVGKGNGCRAWNESRKFSEHRKILLKAQMENKVQDVVSISYPNLSEEEALEIEKNIIREMQPKFNTQHNTEDN